MSGHAYTILYTGEDILPNLSLRETLRVSFSLALPDLDLLGTEASATRDPLAGISRIHRGPLPTSPRT
jgi:hypothetical protein